MNILPQGDAIRKAVQWVSEARQEQPGKSLMKIIEEASLKFNLSPKDAEFLMRFFKKEEPD